MLRKKCSSCGCRQWQRSTTLTVKWIKNDAADETAVTRLMLPKVLPLFPRQHQYCCCCCRCVGTLDTSQNPMSWLKSDASQTIHSFLSHWYIPRSNFLFENRCSTKHSTHVCQIGNIPWLNLFVECSLECSLIVEHSGHIPHLRDIPFVNEMFHFDARHVQRRVEKGGDKLRSYDTKYMSSLSLSSHQM